MSQGTLKEVIDTSALYPLLKRLGESASTLLTRLAILDLTKYEVGSTETINLRSMAWVLAGLSHGCWF